MESIGVITVDLSTYTVQGDALHLLVLVLQIALLVYQHHMHQDIHR